MNIPLKTILVGSSALWLSAMAYSATAQDTGPSTPSSGKPTASGPRGLEEIVVTAQRVSRNLQKTPVAVTSLSGRALKDRGVTNVLQLNALAPNVSIGSRGGTGVTGGAITIRGIGVDANPPASPSVGIYIDDVYFPASYGNLLGLFDVSRIELLRGPQGTLFGRNTIAGAIQYVTVQPKLSDFGGFLEDTVGNLSRNDVTAGINIPLGSIAALRVEGGIQDRDGYVHDVLNNVNRGAERVDQARVQLRVEPNSRLSINLKGEYLEDHTNGGPTITTGENYTTVLGGLYGPHGPFGPNGLAKYLSPDFYTLPGLNAPDFGTTQFRIGQAAMSYKLTDDMTLKSISAYSSSLSRVSYDQDGTPAPIIAVTRGDINDQLFTQELQLVGLWLDGRLHYTLGAYYFNDRSTSTGAVSEFFGGAPMDPFGNFATITHSYAAYGQATYDITQQISVVAGLRYTTEQAGVDDALLQGAGGRIFRDTSPILGLNIQVTPDLLLYFKDSRGFRAGGFSPNANGFFYFSPERATTYEIGARAQLLNGRLRVNPTIFDTNWNNIQFNAIYSPPFVPGKPFFGPLPIIQNAGNAQIKGAEVETEAAVTDNFSLSASASALDGKYTSIDPSQAGNLNLGTALKRSPRTSYTAGAHYVLSLGDRRSAAFSINYAWQAHQRSATTIGDNVDIPSYGLLSARVEFKPFGDRLSFSLFGTNLTGEKYIVGGTNYGNGGLIPATLVDIGPPRQYGLTARVAF